MNRAAFLDRDGTINKLVNGHAPWKLEELEIFPSAKKSIDKLKELELEIVIVSNQPDVKRDLMTEDSLNEITKELMIKLDIRNFYYCMDTPEDNCNCRKPKSGLLKQAAKDLDINISKSYMIGDFTSDIDAGKKCKIKFLIGKPKHKINTKPDHIVKNLKEAVEIISKLEF